MNTTYEQLARLDDVMRRMRERGCRLWLPYRPARGGLRHSIYSALWVKRDRALRQLIESLP